MGEVQIPAGRTRLRAVARVEIEPRDFDETAKFYRRLGFQVTIKGNVGERVAELKAGDVRIRLREGDSGIDRRRAPLQRLRLAIGVAGLDDLVAEVRSKGIEVAPPGMGHPRATEVVDPNGVRILLEEVA